MTNLSDFSNENAACISVCICTYQRPDLLRSALKGVLSQNTKDAFAFEIVVADNDPIRSAENVVRHFQNTSRDGFQYVNIPEPNIALARNAAVKHANGHYIAFIDDDEIPCPHWLSDLYRTLIDSNADGVLGPVLPRFPDNAPQWIKKANIFDRRRFETGTQLTVRHTRTGNVLLRKDLFKKDQLWFDPKFGKTGGEDVNFFQRKIAEGRTFVWCDEAEAYEAVPQDRCTMEFHFKKFIRIGAINGERLRKLRFKALPEVTKTIALLPVKILLLIGTFPFGRHVWMQYALKVAYAASTLLGYGGISLMRYRE